MAFKDLDEFFSIQPIRLPIRGKVYEFPGSVSGYTGLMLHRMTEMAEAVRRSQETGEQVELNEQTTVLDDEQEIDLRSEVLGEAEREMLRDGLPHAFIDHAFKTLIVWHQFGEDVAQAVWEDVPGAPKAPQDRKPSSRKGSSASASTTKRRASSSSTSAPKKPTASAGASSSSTGA